MEEESQKRERHVTKERQNEGDSEVKVNREVSMMYVISGTYPGRGKASKEALRVRTLAYPKLGQLNIRDPVKVSVKTSLSYASLFFWFYRLYFYFAISCCSEWLFVAVLTLIDEHFGAYYLEGKGLVACKKSAAFIVSFPIFSDLSRIGC